MGLLDLLTGNAGNQVAENAENKFGVSKNQIIALLAVAAPLVISYCEDLTTAEEKEKEKLRTAFVYFTGKRHTKVGRPTKKDARSKEKFLGEIEEGEPEGL